jgi:hypothetical protein
VDIIANQIKGSNATGELLKGNFAMKKIRIEFNCGDKHEEAEALRALKADAAYAVLWELDQYLRSLVKYGEEGIAGDTYEACREKLHHFMDANGVSFEEYT